MEDHIKLNYPLRGFVKKEFLEELGNMVTLPKIHSINFKYEKVT